MELFRYGIPFAIIAITVFGSLGVIIMTRCMFDGFKDRGIFARSLGAVMVFEMLAGIGVMILLSICYFIWLDQFKGLEPTEGYDSSMDAVLALIPFIVVGGIITVARILLTPLKVPFIIIFFVFLSIYQGAMVSN